MKKLFILLCIVVITVPGQVKLKSSLMFIYNKMTEESHTAPMETIININNGKITIDNIPLEVIKTVEDPRFDLSFLTTDKTGDLIKVHMDIENYNKVYVSLDQKKYFVVYRCKVIYIK